jgi:XTP/dITP diphosphohydrolase
MPTIVLATQNPGKVRELQSLLADSAVDLIGLDSFEQEFAEPVEDGGTFLANATIKAISYAKATGMHCLADDSGLIVDALGGKPGVISSHYAFDGVETGEAATMTRQQRDELNCQRVLRELEGVADEDRSARFTCTMVLSDPSGKVLATTVGAFEGRIGQIGEVPKGDNGFGYDPLFLVGPDFAQTSAQMDPGEKNALSHRAKAVGAMIEAIQGVFKDN